MAMMGTCIWCRKEHSGTAVEHIIPEIVGCPENFTLKDGEVCKQCNNDLAHLDREIGDTFDFVRFHYDVPRKGNRPPEVTSRGNFVGKYTSEGKTMFINMDPVPIAAPHRTRLGAYGGSGRNIKAEKKVDGDLMEVTCSVEMRFSKKFVRALHKIALESVAYFNGPKEALDEKYDCIRRYVIDGVGERRALALLSNKELEYRNNVWVYPINSRNHVVVAHIAVIECVIDLSEDSVVLADLVKQDARGISARITLPTN